MQSISATLVMTSVYKSAAGAETHTFRVLHWRSQWPPSIELMVKQFHNRLRGIRAASVCTAFRRINEFVMGVEGPFGLSTLVC
jgi:hypothetical protein